MAHMTKRLISVLLLLAMLLALFPAGAFAEEPPASVNAPVGAPTYAAENSLGTLLTHTIEDGDETGDTRFPGAVTDLKADGKVVKVDLAIDRPAQLVVAIYTDSETDVQMLGSGETTVESGMQEAVVSIDIDAMPTFFVAAAYLLDPETHEPLSDSYISRYYTAEFQAFLGTTVSDYDQDLVLNLDNDNSTNFLVYSEDVLRFTETPGVNELTGDDNGTYVIRSADARFRALKAGDSFAYTFADGTLLIVVAASVTVSGDTVTVVEDPEATLDAVFSLYKIDAESVPGEGYVSMSEADSGVAFAGTGRALVSAYAAAQEPFYDNTDAPDTDSAYDEDIEMAMSDNAVYFSGLFSHDVDAKTGTKFEFSIDTGSVMSGSVIFKAYVAVKIYKSGSWTSKTVKMDYSAGIEVEIGASFSKEILLGMPTIPLGASGVSVRFPISFVVKASGSVTTTGELKGTIGYTEDSDYGRQSLTSWPSFESSVELSASIYFGFKLEVEVVFIVKQILNVGFSVNVGVSANAKLAGWIYEEPSDSKKHLCATCVTGDLSVTASVSLKFKAIFGVIENQVKLIDVKYKLADFYYSKDFKEFGWNRTCPHIAYKVTAQVYEGNNQNQMVSGAALSCGGDALGVTDENGEASFYLPNGIYEISIVKDNLSVVKRITVRNSAKKAYFNMSASGGDDPDFPPPSPPRVVASGMYNDKITWTIYSDHSLVFSGSGSMYDKSSYLEYQDYQSEIETVVFEEGISYIGKRVLDGNFSAVKEISFPKSVTYIDSSAYSISSAASLKAINVDSGNTRYCSIQGILYDYFFSDKPKRLLFCPYAITDEVVIPENVTQIDSQAFCRCKLTGVTFPSTLTEIHSEAFWQCENLKTVTIPDTVRVLQDGAFKECGALQSVRLSKNLSSIEESMFYECDSLREIIIPDGVSTIEARAFGGCNILSRVTIPGSMKTIGYNAFSSCWNIKNVYYYGSPDQWKAISIDSSNSPCLTVYPTRHYATEEEEDNMAAESGDTIPALPVAAFVGESGVQNGLRLASFQGLVPGGAYVLVVTADENADALLASANLLYIAQGTADENGCLTLGYIPRLESVGGVTLYGMSPRDLSQATITVEQFSNGDCCVTVIYEDAALIENRDYFLTTKEEGLSFTATITGRGDYSGTQSVEGQKLAVTVRMEDGEGSVRRAKRLGESFTLPTVSREGLTFAGWSTERSADTATCLAGESYETDSDAVFYAVWVIPGIDCVLPAMLTEIEAEAFCGCAFQGVSIGSGVIAIDSRAFAGSPALRAVRIPASVTVIADDAFDGIGELTVYGDSGSTAETYSAAHGFTFIRLS